MKTLAALVVGLLVLFGGLGYAGYKVYGLGHEVAQVRSDLAGALAANATQADALGELQADRAKDNKLLVQLDQRLQAISKTQASKRATVAQVVKDAAPPEKAVLTGKLPAAVMQLLPRSGVATANSSSGAVVSP